MMDSVASVAEFTQEVGELYFEFAFNQASFNTSFVDIENQLPPVSFGTIQVELGNEADTQAIDLFFINFVLQSDVRLVANAE